MSWLEIPHSRLFSATRYTNALTNATRNYISSFLIFVATRVAGLALTIIEEILGGFIPTKVQLCYSVDG